MSVLLANSIALSGLSSTIDSLKKFESSIDSVEKGIRLVESDPEAGWVGFGGAPNMLGEVELDAGIMDGKSLNAGAVGALKGYLHPISVARMVMERTPHVLLVGDGASRFARDCGAETGDNLTEKSRKDWMDWLEKNMTLEEKAKWPDTNLLRLGMVTADPSTAKGTTVFLASDNNNNICAASSTSGWSYKLPGRIGDSCIIGSGCYADNRYGAVACTGMGELTSRINAARRVILYLKNGLSLEDACRETINDLRGLCKLLYGGISIYAIDNKSNKCMVSVKAKGANLPDCDPFCWYWDSESDSLGKIESIMETW